jgi:hypothetical protein
MPAFIVLPHGAYAVGVHNIAPTSIPVGVSALTFAFDRAEWVEACLVDVVVDLSLDDGVTWNEPHPDADPYPAGFTVPGGDRLDKFGAVISQTVLRLSIPQSENTTRQLRATVTITGASLVTTGTLTVN